MSKLSVAGGAFAIGVVLLFGLFLLFKGLRNVRLALGSTKWPMTAGTVVDSSIRRDVTRNTQTKGERTTYSATTAIRYKVDGGEYTTNLRHFGQTLGSGDSSAAALETMRYPVGRKVSVSYKPGDPATAVMKPGLHAEAFELVGAGLAFLVPALVCLAIAPAILRGFKSDDSAFSDSVKSAIERAQRGEKMPEVPFHPPADPGGNMIGAVVAGTLAALACGFGVLLLSTGLARMWQGNASVNWPKAPGVVIVGAGDMEGGGYNRFIYQYEVDGMKHLNNVRRSSAVAGETGMNEVAQYTKGANVTVSYFPADPDISVVEPGTDGASFVLPGFALGMLLFGLAAFKWIVPAILRS